MSEPFTPAQIASCLRRMSPDRLRAVKPQDFQRHPVRKIVPAAVIRELISNETARRV